VCYQARQRAFPRAHAELCNQHARMALSLAHIDRGKGALALGLLAVSTSGPFFVMAQMSAYAAVFWRTALGGGLALMLCALRGALALPALRSHRNGLLLSGLLLGPHFLLWVRAFELTDFASNLILLVAQPVWSALLDRARGRALPARAPQALALATLGLVLVTGADLSIGPRALLGDVCCIGAGLIGALFFEAGRSARLALPLDAYMGVTLIIAASTALPVAWMAGVPLLDYPCESWAWLSAIVLVSTLAGHSLLNAAARTLSLFTVNMAILIEPVLAIGLGAVLFGAVITAAQLAGAALLLGSVGALIASSALARVPAA